MRFSGETLAVGVSGSLGFLQAIRGAASCWRGSRNEEVSYSVRLSSVSGNRTSFAPERPRQMTTNTIELERNRSKINETDRYSDRS
jgi:hypothetical protein